MVTSQPGLESQLVKFVPQLHSHSRHSHTIRFGMYYYLGQNLVILVCLFRQHLQVKQMFALYHNEQHQTKTRLGIMQSQLQLYFVM